MNYEKIRKQRKKIEKEAEQVNYEQQQLRKQLSRAINPAPAPTYSQNGQWDDFF